MVLCLLRAYSRRDEIKSLCGLQKLVTFVGEICRFKERMRRGVESCSTEIVF